MKRLPDFVLPLKCTSDILPRPIAMSPNTDSLRCSECNSENPIDARFCIGCGRPLGLRCSSCEVENPAAAKFCKGCGKELRPSRGIPRATIPDPSAAAGERRHLTVLFSDLVGSTVIAGRLDPEEWQKIASDYQRAARDAVLRYGGNVARYLGDGVLALFGWPEAHENDAERASRSGLAIREAVRELNIGLQKRGGPRLDVRVGIHSGEAVIGTDASDGPDIFGDTPNVAARVQSAAESDSVFISETTFRLVSGLFDVEDRGTPLLKGVDRPVHLYRLERSTGLRGRPVSAGRSQTPMVGREEELHLLASRWARACQGEGQVVTIVGEPGIGKTRLVQEFAARISAEPHSWIEGGGTQFYDSTPFFAVTEMVRRMLGWHSGEKESETVAALEHSLQSVGMKIDEAVPLIAGMLGFPIPEKYPALMSVENQQRKSLFANLTNWMLNIARLQPTVIAIEDLHWLDPSSLELVQILVDQAARAPMLLIQTTRPEFRIPWPLRSHHAQIALAGLSRKDAREMIADLLARKTLTSELVDMVLDRTSGVPLFLEEVTLSVVERGNQSAREIPATLADSLMSRLDRLGPAREVAQLAAAIGRTFSYELLQALSSSSENTLQAALTALADAELITASGLPPTASYSFKHALIQDVAYGTLLKSKRKELHGKIASVLTEKFRDFSETHPAVLARHFTEAGEVQAAIESWLRAGDFAQERGSFKEAEDCYYTSLSVIETLPESPERDSFELRVLDQLVDPIAVNKGFTAPELVKTNARLRVLASRSGNLDQLAMQARNDWFEAFPNGDLALASILAQRYLELVESKESSPQSIADAHMVKSSTLYWQAEFEAYESYFAASAPDAFQDPVDQCIHLGHAALNAWTLGNADLARARIEDSVKRARQSGALYVIAVALSFDSALRVLLREVDNAERSGSEGLTIAEEQGFPYFAARCRISLGWALGQLGQHDKGIGLLKAGLNDMAVLGTRLAMPVHLTWLAEAHACKGETDVALNTIEQALTVNPVELVHRPETLRLRGELRMRLGQNELAESDYEEAISLSRRVGAKIWTLRATTSLARALQARGDSAAAREALSSVYAPFTEGQDTYDLIEAKQLLHDLSVRAA